MKMKKISPCLWFADQAEQAAAFYTSVFKGGKILGTTRYGTVGVEIHGRPAGSVMTVNFEIAGETFTALNGGPVFTFNEAVSFQIIVENQEELDYYWDKLSEGGDPKAQVCGWLKDQFGLSWQVVPANWEDMMRDPESEGAKRAMAAMFRMKKLDIAALERAYEGK